jgi:outer membrane protein insertion porin family
MSQDKTVRVFAFFDAGSVWQEGEPIAFDDLRASTGVGLSWLSPVGPLKISLGTVLKKKETDETQRFQFQIGTGF